MKQLREIQRSLPYVLRLEMPSAQLEESMPSGDDLAAEFEAFLRDHNRSNGDN